MTERNARLQATKSRLGVTARKGDPEQIREARREHAAAKLEAYVERIVAEAPPLTPAQRDRIAALLRPASGEAREDEAREKDRIRDRDEAARVLREALSD